MGRSVGRRRAVWREVTDPGRWRAMLDATLATLHLDQLSGAAAWLAAAAAGILATALLAAAGWLFWLLGRRLRSRWTGNHGRMARRRTHIEFYRRFETLLARRGILPAPGQTQREFAAAAAARLAQLGDDPQLSRLPGVIADAFYRVRFGGQPLDSLQAQAVEHANRRHLLNDCRRRLQSPISSTIMPRPLEKCTAPTRQLLASGSLVGGVSLATRLRKCMVRQRARYLAQPATGAVLSLSSFDYLRKIPRDSLVGVLHHARSLSHSPIPSGTQIAIRYHE